MDIDIDFQSTFDPTKVFKRARLASMVKNGELVKHPCGVYFQQIPIDPITNLSAIPYREAENLGYFKIDFLHLHLLDHFSSKEEIRQLIHQEPDWNILSQEQHVRNLFQIGKHYKLITIIKPRSVQELADVIALIRPGKSDLISLYLTDKQTARKHLYAKTSDGYYFKRSHAISYALTIVLQMHLIARQQ